MVGPKKRRLFSEISPFTYAISVQKGIVIRHLRDAMKGKKFATTISKDKLPHVVAKNVSELIKKGPGIDPELQYNKAHNIDIAAQCLNGLLVKPGEEVSFWKLIGNTTERRGYKDGRVIMGGRLEAGIGGGLCNLANSLNLLILHSPLEITELHTHSDALAPDFDHRTPFGNGTSVSYNYIDYRFKNTTDQDIQILLWCEDERLHGELRSQVPFDEVFDLIEEDHHFVKEGDDYYRRSKIYRQKSDAQTKAVKEKELIWDNHSLVMFDPSIIPDNLIR